MNTPENNRLTKSLPSTWPRDSGQQDRIAVGRRLLRERGAALIVVLLLAALSLSIGLFAVRGSKTELQISNNDLAGRKALAIAEAGLQHAYRLIRNDVAAGLTLTDELGNSGTGGGIGSTLAGMSVITNLTEPDGTSKSYRSRAFGCGDDTCKYYVRVEDNVDETMGVNVPGTDVDNRIWIIARGRFGSAERIVRAMFQRGFPSVGLFGRVIVTVTTGVDSCDSTPLPGKPTGTCIDGGPFGTSARVESDGDINLNNKNIGGSVTAVGTITGAGGVTPGPVTSGASPRNFPPAAVVAPFSCPPYNSSTAGIDPPANYDTTTHNIDGANITLQPGNYCFNNLNVTGSLAVNGNGPVTIYLTGTGTLREANAAPPPPPPGTNLQLFSSGPSLTINSGSATRMSIYAPDTNLTFEGAGGAFYGAAIGATVTLQGGNNFHHDVSLSLGATQTQLTGWHEVRN